MESDTYVVFVKGNRRLTSGTGSKKTPTNFNRR